MASKRKFKRDYIILEAKDMNFRYKERILPKAFAKVEINDEKSVVALYVENLKFVKEGYRVVVIQSDYDTVDLGNILVSEQGKGEFILNLENSDTDIKGIAMLYEKTVPLIGFKGNKIENYEEILFTGDDSIDEEDDFEEYEEIEYIEVDDGDEYEEYEEIEYIEIEDEDEVKELSRYQDEDEEDEDEDEYEEYEEHDEEEEYEVYPEVEDEEEYIVENASETTGNLPYEQKKTKINNKKKNEKVKPRNHDDNSYESYQKAPHKYESKTAGALLMPRQIKKGLKLFREVKPFVSDYIEDTRWWKIEVNPVTLCGYTMPNLGYVNTLNYTMYSDTVMNSYKYRHYLFGVQYDEYNKRRNYIYAVPGNKHEQPDKGRTGFNTYQPCDTRNDNLGYWICFIDSRSRRIVK